MIVLVIGALSVGDPEPKTWISSLSSAYADVPLVLVSDREETKEVLAAFEAGVSAFIPTSIAPSVAMQAFTFIMSGGTSFRQQHSCMPCGPSVVRSTDQATTPPF
jgi:DNA-binding NarL/FixJ family response regulator